MEPLTPNDPLWKVLGQSRPVGPRPNFVQNVVRAARQTPQEKGLLAQVKGWWQGHENLPGGLTWAAVAAVVIAITASVYGPQSSPQVTANPSLPALLSEPVLTEADFPLKPEFETEWKNLEQMGNLLAVQDTSELTDTEIHLLLY